MIVMVVFPIMLFIPVVLNRVFTLHGGGGGI